MAKRILINDEVIVISGQDKGKIGIVNSFFKDRVVVKGINTRKKTVKSRDSKGNAQEGGFKSVDMPIDISNIAIYNADTKAKDKVIFIDDENNKKKRCYYSNKKEISLKRVK